MKTLTTTQMRQLKGGDDSCDQILVSAMAAMAFGQVEIAAGLMAGYLIMGCRQA